MSQSGALVFFITEEHQDPEGLLSRLVAWLGADWVFFANRTLRDSNEWELTQRAALNPDLDNFPSYEKICGRCAPSELTGKFRYGTELFIDFSKAPRTSEVCQAHADLPENLRGNFNPGSPIVSLGWHDLVDELPDEESLLARSFLTVKIWGYGTPANDPRYRKEIWDQPFVQDFERELAALVAPHPLHHAVMFSY